MQSEAQLARTYKLLALIHGCRVSWRARHVVQLDHELEVFVGQMMVETLEGPIGAFPVLLVKQPLPSNHVGFAMLWAWTTYASSMPILISGPPITASGAVCVNGSSNAELGPAVCATSAPAVVTSYGSREAARAARAIAAAPDLPSPQRAASRRQRFLDLWLRRPGRRGWRLG